MPTRKSQLTSTTNSHRVNRTVAQSPPRQPSDQSQPSQKARPQLTLGKPDARGVCDVDLRIGRFGYHDRFNPEDAQSRRRFITKVRTAKHRCKPSQLRGLDKQIVDAARAANTQPHPDADPSKAPEAARAQEPAESDPEILEAAEGFLNNPDKFDELRSDIETVGIVGEADLATTVYLIGSSAVSSF